MGIFKTAMTASCARGDCRPCNQQRQKVWRLGAQVVGALSGPQQLAVSQALDDMGVRLGPGPLSLRVRMAYGMFDTRGRCAPARLIRPACATGYQGFDIPLQCCSPPVRHV